MFAFIQTGCLCCLDEHFDIYKISFGNLIIKLFTFQLGLRVSMYYVYLKEWLDLYPREQIHIIKAEEYYKDRTSTLAGVFKYLGLGKLIVLIVYEWPHI